LGGRFGGCFRAKKGVQLGVFKWVIWRENLGQFRGCFFLGGGGGGGVLRAEFKGGKMHISKLAYKCMIHETNSHEKNGRDLLKSMNVVLEPKSRLVPLRA